MDSANGKNENDLLAGCETFRRCVSHSFGPLSYPKDCTTPTNSSLTKTWQQDRMQTSIASASLACNYRLLCAVLGDSDADVYFPYINSNVRQYAVLCCCTHGRCGSCYLTPSTPAKPASNIKGTADAAAGVYWFKACKREAWGRVYVLQ